MTAILQKDTQKSFRSRVQELCKSRGGRPGLPVPNSLCGLRGRQATLEEVFVPLATNTPRTNADALWNIYYRTAERAILCLTSSNTDKTRPRERRGFCKSVTK